MFQGHVTKSVEPKYLVTKNTAENRQSIATTNQHLWQPPKNRHTWTSKYGNKGYFNAVDECPMSVGLLPNLPRFRTGNLKYGFQRVDWSHSTG